MKQPPLHVILAVVCLVLSSCGLFGGLDDGFGYALALEDKTLAVGAIGESSGVGGDEPGDSLQASGAVFIRALRRSAHHRRWMRR